ncbi:energy transducer TonB family protein [Altererythrobacter sp. Z27]|uniref:energy transducer TonB family protein n=1 Tax=Altererythrobacter sp. Z27 TaxID=3461147 RepID=UPI004043E9E6
MNTLLKLSLATALAGVAVASPLASQEIRVVPTADGTQRFISDVSHDLDQELGMIDLDNWRFRGGFAQVRFQVDPEGRAENVTLYRKSGDRQVDRTALRAVERLDSIGELPAGYPDDQVIQANIVLARSESQMASLNKRLRRVEEARIAEAAGKPGAPVLALSIVVNSPS